MIGQLTMEPLATHDPLGKPAILPACPSRRICCPAHRATSRCGTILVTNASMGLMEWMILRGPHLLHPDCEGQLGLFQSVLTTGLLLVALLLDVLVPVVNMYALLPIFAERPISVLRSRRLSRKRP